MLFHCDLVFWALRILRCPPDLPFLPPEPEVVGAEGGDGSRGTAKFSLLFNDPSTEAARWSVMSPPLARCPLLLAAAAVDEAPAEVVPLSAKSLIDAER